MLDKSRKSVLLFTVNVVFTCFHEDHTLSVAVRALDRAKAAGLYAQSSALDEPLASIENSDSDHSDADDDYSAASSRKKFKT